MRRALVAVVAAAVILLSGCSQIPTTGSVQPGTTEAPNGTGLVYVPNAPAPGAKPQEIVSGFLTAASGGGSFRVAKEYLTSGFAKRWKPRTRVLVQSSRATLTGTGADIRADVPISATVDDKGAYTALSDSEPLPFHLVQEGGQWRIDSAENGIVLTETVFQQIYAPRLLQFFDPTWTRLVPDRRWFPAPQADEASAPDPEEVVSSLIDGPVGPLGKGVAANALRGTKLAGISPSTAGITTVTLSVDGPMPNATTTARMQQQLAQTLGLPTPAALRLVVNSLVVPQARAVAAQLGTEAYVLVGGKFGTLSSAGAFSEERTLGPRIAATRPSAITASLRQKTAAVRTGSRTVALVTPSGAKPVDSRPGLVAPALDQQGWVYSVPANDPSGLQVSNGKRTYPLDVDLGSGAVTTIQVSPDGTRLLVLLADPSGATAYVAGIERDADGAPKGLTAAQYPVDLSHTSGAGLDATWMGDGDVAVLVRGQDSDQVATQQLGGIEVTLAPFAGVTSLVGTSSVDDLRIRVSNGTLYVWDDPNNWQQVTTDADVSVLAVQR